LAAVADASGVAACVAAAAGELLAAGDPLASAGDPLASGVSLASGDAVAVGLSGLEDALGEFATAATCSVGLGGAVIS
jgi:hypothetical protein